jgi:hypothetical protein
MVPSEKRQKSQKPKNDENGQHLVPGDVMVRRYWPPLLLSHVALPCDDLIASGAEL